MRKLTLTIVGLAALVATSVAVAHGIAGARSARPVSATFGAAGSAVTTRTCTTNDSKTIVVTTGTYTGKSSGDADLTGTITLRARSVVNTTDNVGTVNGTFRIDVDKGRDTRGAFATVYDHGSVAGMLTGVARDPRAQVLGNMSAKFGATGFTDGKIGGGTAGGGAVELAVTGCKSEDKTPPKEHSAARGSISALSASSITVAGLTCTIVSNGNARMSALPPKLRTGDRVDIRCDVANGQNVLTRIAKLR
jgi:hypothetical protein